MKKHLFKLLTFVFCMALFLTGCASLSGVEIDGKDAYFQDVQYSQGHVLKVGDYLFYGNGYTASDSEGFSYKKAKNSGYLARINLKDGLTFDQDVKDVNKKHSSPENIQKVNGDKLIGYQYQDMYALGEYIYFTSANTHKTSDMENDYARVSLFRVKYNGDGFKELVKNSAFKTGEGSSITLQKGSDDNYYFLIAEPTEESTFTIKSLKVGDKIGELKTIVEDAKTYVLGDNNSTVKNVVYTVDSEKEQTTTSIKSVDFATGDETIIDNGEAGSETKLIDRVGDSIFYSYTMDSITEVYKISATSNNGYAPNSNKYFYPASTISNVHKAGDGFVFKTEGGALMYHDGSNADPVKLAKSDEYSDILFTQEDYVYISNPTTIKRVSTIDQEVETIVEVTDMVSGQCGYADGYIYFYSKLGELELDDEEEKTTDDNYYMYRTDLTGNIQLIGQTL